MFSDFCENMSDTYNIIINIGRRRRRRIKNLALSFSQPVEKTVELAKESAKLMATATAVMTDTQKLSAKITPEDANGNPVPIPDGDLVVWTSSDPTVVTVTPDVSGLTAVCASVGKVGTATINVVINNASGAAIASATGDIQVTAAGISQVAISFGTPS